MASENIFSGLKVVDPASFIAGPRPAVILSDFGADVIKVEPPGRRPLEKRAQAAASTSGERRLSVASGQPQQTGYNARSEVSGRSNRFSSSLVRWADVFIVNTPHPARKKLKLEYEDVMKWNPRLIYADLTGSARRAPTPICRDSMSRPYWARSGLLSMTRDAGAPPTWPVAGSGDNATAVGLVFGNRHGALSSRAHR